MNITVRRATEADADALAGVIFAEGGEPRCMRHGAAQPDVTPDAHA